MHDRLQAAAIDQFRAQESHGVEMARGGDAADKPITLDRVTIEFRANSRGIFTAVENISLDVAAGEFIAIVGPTGCGKSTLLILWQAF